MHQSLLVGVMQSLCHSGDQFGGFPIFQPALFEFRRKIGALDVL